MHPDIVAEQPFGPGNINGHVTFGTYLTNVAVGTLFHADFTYDGQPVNTFDTVLTFPAPNIMVVVFSGNFPLSYSARPAVLNIDVGGVTASYTFTVREPIPEPASLLLMGTGLLILFAVGRSKLSFNS